MKKAASIAVFLFLLLAAKSLVAQEIELRCWPMNDTLLSGTSNTITLRAKDRKDMKVVFPKGVKTNTGTVRFTFYTEVSKSLIGKTVTVKVRKGNKVVYKKTYPVVEFTEERRKRIYNTEN